MSSRPATQLERPTTRTFGNLWFTPYVNIGFSWGSWKFPLTGTKISFQVITIKFPNTIYVFPYFVALGLTSFTFYLPKHWRRFLFQNRNWKSPIFYANVGLKDDRFYAIRYLYWASGKQIIVIHLTTLHGISIQINYNPVMLFVKYISQVDRRYITVKIFWNGNVCLLMS